MSASANPASDVRPAWTVRLRAGFERVQRTVEGWDILDLVGTFTVILVLILNGGAAAFQAPIRVLCIAALIYRPLVRHPAFWLVLTGVLGVMYGREWYISDNHHFLITYWCLAFGLSTLAEEPAQTLRTNARLLIGLCFLLAAIWKLRTPDFIIGDFFHFTLLTDERFKNVAELLGGMDPAALSYDQVNASAALTNFNSTLHEASLQSNSRVALVADVLTWWTLFIEMLIGVAFLAPQRWFISRWRDFMLVSFLLTTYAVAFVLSFAWVLAIMGLAQASRSFKYARLLYLATLFLTLLLGYEWSWILRFLMRN